MTGSGAYQTTPLTNFETSYNKLVKKYYRKNRKGKEDLDSLVEGFFRLIRSNPRAPAEIGHQEPWPAGLAQPGFELWKIHFDMPGLRGAAGEGRLIYLIDKRQRIVYPVWIYTHDQFSKRPSDKDLRSLLKAALRSDS